MTKLNGPMVYFPVWGPLHYKKPQLSLTPCIVLKNYGSTHGAFVDVASFAQALVLPMSNCEVVFQLCKVFLLR